MDSVDLQSISGPAAANCYILESETPVHSKLAYAETAVLRYVGWETSRGYGLRWMHRRSYNKINNTVISFSHL